jgi:hypothetical protein
LVNIKLSTTIFNFIWFKHSILGHYEKLPKHREPPVHAVEEKPVQHVYPTEAPYTGALSSIHRHYDPEHLPLEHHVTIYHHGRSDIHEKSEEPVKEKSDLLGKFSSLFKRGHAHLDQPTSEVYTGPLESTHRQLDLEHPFEVSKYHEGFYTHLPKHEEPKVEEVVRVPEKHIAGYPEFYQHEGPTSETGRKFELYGEPLESHVQVYAPGKYLHKILDLIVAKQHLLLLIKCKLQFLATLNFG